MGVKKKFLIIIKRPGEEATIGRIGPGLKPWQDLITLGGEKNMVERLSASSVGLPNDVQIFFNEEGRQFGAPVNFYLTYPNTKQPWDEVRGTAFFMSEKNGKSKDISPAQCQAILDYLKERSHAQQ